MNIIFPSVDEHYIKTKVQEGFYSNATELVRDAVRRLREKDDTAEHILLNALKEGEIAIREGHFRPYTPQLLKELEQQARKNVKNNKPLNPHVCP
jgi:antitoxin ParD1/3/4